LIGEIFLKRADTHLAAAEEWIQKAIVADQKNGMRWHLAKDYALYAEFFRRKGAPTSTIENFNLAIEIFKECGADGWVAKYETEISRLS
jgi:hypothetical protein